jgi:integrase/recombinase XerC
VTRRRTRAQGSIYRRGGELAWTIAYRVAGRRHTERAFADKAASEQLLADRLREAAREQVGLLDPHRKHRAAAIATHVAAFVAGIESRHRTGKHVELVRARLEHAIASMGVARIQDLDQARAERFLAQVLEHHSPKTRDHYASTLRQFGQWLEDADRLVRNPLRRLQRVSRAGDARVERQALTPAQVLQLVASAEQRPLQLFSGPQDERRRVAAAGRRRGTLYLFSALTGLRRAECAGIRWCDLVGIDTPEPSVAPRASTTKARREERLPLVEPLVGRLVELRTAEGLRRGRPPRPRDPVFEVPKNLTEQLRKDAAWCDLAAVDDLGRRLDFHALRATFATGLARAGVPLQAARRLMRHSTPAMTAKHYEKLEQADLRAGAQALSDAFETAAAAAVAATDRAPQGQTDTDTTRQPAPPRGRKWGNHGS